MPQKEPSKDEAERLKPPGGTAASDPEKGPIEIDVHDESDRYHGRARKSVAVEKES
jgi:hypothetical protein